MPDPTTDPEEDSIDRTVEAPPYDAAAVGRAYSLLDAMPDRIGRYRILERLGGGGMGEVYVAEQTEPIKRRVAVKVIKAGMDTRQVVARFEAERQALAMMDHPNIARVFDAGSTDTGRPYFVMELVRGVPITKFADENKLTTRQRVELLVPICQAVQHAHQKGIIHRDIKPHNVLVTLHDGKPVPKVIDFGIAKATSQPLTDKTVYTEFRQMIGTPAYMSPEQAEMSGLDIDTRSDIYSLGVLAYELLTGSPPFENDRLVKAGLAEIQRIIKEEDPPRPSIRLSTVGDRLTTIAKSRDVEPSKLSKLLAGELDWIVMRAMEKDRKRRYDTATDLAADFNRHLSGEPVVAAPPTWGYRTRKFVRKHRGPVIAAAAVIAVLSLGLGGTTWEAFRAAKERNKAEDANAHLRDDQETAIETLGQIVPPDPRVSRRKMAEAMIAGAKSVAHDTKLGWEGPNGIGRPEISEVGFLALIAKQNYRWLQEKTEAAELEAYTADLALAQSAMSSGNWPEARARLDACPQSKRGWEWKFLRKQAGKTKYAVGTVYGFSKDAKYFLAPTSTDQIRLYDSATGNPCRDSLLETPAGGFNRLPRSLSPKADFAIAAYSASWRAAGTSHQFGEKNDTIQIWGTVTGRPGPPVSVPEGVRGTLFSPDGSLVVTWTAEAATPSSKGAEFTAQLWAVPGCTRVGGILKQPAEIEQVVFSPDSSRVVTLSRHTAKIWNSRKGEFMGNIALVDDPWFLEADRVQFSPDGKNYSDQRSWCLAGMEWSIRRARGIADRRFRLH